MTQIQTADREKRNRRAHPTSKRKIAGRKGEKRESMSNRKQKQRSKENGGKGGSLRYNLVEGLVLATASLERTVNTGVRGLLLVLLVSEESEDSNDDEGESHSKSNANLVATATAIIRFGFTNTLGRVTRAVWRRVLLALDALEVTGRTSGRELVGRACSTSSSTELADIALGSGDTAELLRTIQVISGTANIPSVTNLAHVTRTSGLAAHSVDVQTVSSRARGGLSVTHELGRGTQATALHTLILNTTLVITASSSVAGLSSGLDTVSTPLDDVHSSKDGELGVKVELGHENDNRVTGVGSNERTGRGANDVGDLNDSVMLVGVDSKSSLDGSVGAVHDGTSVVGVERGREIHDGVVNVPVDSVDELNRLLERRLGNSVTEVGRGLGDHERRHISVEASFGREEELVSSGNRLGLGDGKLEGGNVNGIGRFSLKESLHDSGRIGSKLEEEEEVVLVIITTDEVGDVVGEFGGVHLPGVGASLL